MSDDLRYPIGKFSYDGMMTDARRTECVARIAAAPAGFRAAVAGLDDGQLDTPYRPGGWTVRQVVHHVPDSHLNAYTRIRLALTEDIPTIKPYEEARWAELPDARSLPVEISLGLLESLHARWVPLLRRLGPAEGARQLRHPEYGRLMTIDELLAMYAWHGEHHTAHVTRLRERMGWR
jgi:DinB family protein